MTQTHTKWALCVCHTHCFTLRPTCGTYAHRRQAFALVCEILIHCRLTENSWFCLITTENIQVRIPFYMAWILSAKGAQSTWDLHDKAVGRHCDSAASYKVATLSLCSWFSSGNSATLTKTLRHHPLMSHILRGCFATLSVFFYSVPDWKTVNLANMPPYLKENLWEMKVIKVSLEPAPRGH